MKNRDRIPAASLKYPLSRQNDFCVCRVLVGWALATIESFDNLPAAKRFMRRHRRARSGFLRYFQPDEQASLSQGGASSCVYLHNSHVVRGATAGLNGPYRISRVRAQRFPFHRQTDYVVRQVKLTSHWRRSSPTWFAHNYLTASFL